MDRFAALFSRFKLHARIFHAGPLCRQVWYDGASRYGFFHLLREGSLEIETEGDERRAVDEASLIFYPRPVGHRLLPRSGGGCDIVCAAIDFGARVGNPVLEGLPSVVVVPLSRLAELRTSLTLLFDEAGRSQAGRQAVLDRVAEVVVIQVLRHLCAEGRLLHGPLAGLGHAGIGKALASVHENAAHPWSVAELAGRAGMSRARFALRFREVVGQTPGDYLLRWRISLAKALLRQGRPLKLIANEVGYATAASFSRAFAAETGQAPSAWLAAERALTQAP